MLKRAITFLMLEFCIPACLLAQGSPVDELRAPAIPAFALQQGTVSSVPVPTTPNEFAADMQTFASGSGLRQGYGMEATLRSLFAPSEYETFRASLKDPGFLGCLWRTASISLASGSSGLPSDTSGTGVSFGFRIQPIIGYVSDTIDTALHKYDIYQSWPGTVLSVLVVPSSAYLHENQRYSPADVDNAAAQAVRDEKNLARTIKNPPSPSDAEWTEIQNIVSQIIHDCPIGDSASASSWRQDILLSENKFLNSDTAKKLLHSMHDLSLNRYGIVCEVDAAGKWDWIGSSSDNEHYEKMGAWASIGYKDEWSGFNIAVLARYLNYTPLIDSSNRLEYGASLGCHGANWNITAEYLGQKVNAASPGKADSSVFTDRYDVNITYAPNSLITATITIGKDFTDTKAKVTPVLAALGFNFNWSELSKFVSSTQ